MDELTWTVDGTDWNSSVLNYSVSGWWLLLVVYSRTRKALPARILRILAY